jgi:2-phospho-L-lactate guanylyltransferase
MKLAVAVPMKPFALAKARLRPGLDDAARQKLAADMLRHVLATIAASRVAEACGVVSADPAALAIAAEYDFEAIDERGVSGYNEASGVAIAWAQARRAEALLLLPADLPFLTAEDIRNLVRLADDHYPVLVISPDRQRQGTNALLLRPPGIISPSFGEDSFLRHQRLARIAKIDHLVYLSPGIAQDIDWPEDLQHLARK